MPFNTLYQLRALVEQQPELVSQAAHALLIPDYFSFRLTGNLNWEYTNATTTQLVNINSDSWDETLLNWTGAPLAWFGKPTHPGNVIGHWICPQGNRIPVVAVASHDTASAVIASPLADRHAAYLSSGTWSLMGFESLTPYTCDAALQANITNEGGAEGRYRVLKNIMGLWLLQRVLKEQNVSDLQGLIARTAALPACRFIIDCNDDRFINPASMSAGSRPPVATPGSRFLKAMPNWRAAFSTAWRCSTPGCLTSWRRCAATPSASCISSAAAVRTRCSTSCALTPAGSPSWPAR